MPSKDPSWLIDARADGMNAGGGEAEDGSGPVADLGPQDEAAHGAQQLQELLLWQIKVRLRPLFQTTHRW